MPLVKRTFLVKKKNAPLKDESGKIYSIPSGWELLPPGDAALTRKLKSLGPTWTVQEKKGRKTFSHGVWAATSLIAQAKADVEAKRSDPKHQKKMAQAKLKRLEKEDEFGVDFLREILIFLDFSPKYESVAQKLSLLVKEHAVPVGSGTVARSSSVELCDKAALAVMAWMRHQCSDYDKLSVPRVKGARRELRRQIAVRSRKILKPYREGEEVDERTCRLAKALRRLAQ